MHNSEKTEIKRINTEHTLKTSDLKRQKQLDAINAKLGSSEIDPSKPPIKDHVLS